MRALRAASLSRPALLGAVLLLASAGCVSGSRIRASLGVIRGDLERARKTNAERCAPRELAKAEANVDFAEGELSEGSSLRAQQHVEVAEENVKAALELSKDCATKTVTIAAKPQIAIAVVDQDGDGTPDLEDRCPTVPGPVENKGCPDKDGDGTVDPDDRCIDVPGPRENQGCPSTRDSDGDGIPDDLDRCPQQPEDRDGFQDEDGCPEMDNDNDGVVDARDLCPNEVGPLDLTGCADSDGDKVADFQDACPAAPGVPSSDPARNGCPGDSDGDGITDDQDKCPTDPGPRENNGCPVRVYKLVVVKKDRIEIKQQVKFATNKSKVLPESFGLLDQVVQVLKDFPGIRKMRVEGHTDNVGQESHNMRLSQDRADSVKAYLVGKGVDPGRLESVGYGPTKPMASNSTAKGRAENRRTEFNITERE